MLDRSKEKSEGGSETPANKDMLLENCLEKVRLFMIEKNTFAKTNLKFSIRMEDIPPILPSKQRQAEINTEKEKRSVYLKSNATKVEGNLCFLHYCRIGKIHH